MLESVVYTIFFRFSCMETNFHQHAQTSKHAYCCAWRTYVWFIFCGVTNLKSQPLAKYKMRCVYNVFLIRISKRWVV